LGLRLWTLLTNPLAPTPAGAQPGSSRQPGSSHQPGEAHIPLALVLAAEEELSMPVPDDFEFLLCMAAPAVLVVVFAAGMLM